MAKRRMDKPVVHFAQRSHEDLTEGDKDVTRIRRYYLWHLATVTPTK